MRNTTPSISFVTNCSITTVIIGGFDLSEVKRIASAYAEANGVAYKIRTDNDYGAPEYTAWLSFEV